MAGEDLINRLDVLGVSDDHMVALLTEERDVQFPIVPLSQPMLTRRSEVLAFLHITLVDLQWPLDDMFFAAQLLDAAGIWFEADARVQVVSVISSCYVCLKLRANPQEADRENPLRELVERANQFLRQNVDEREVELTEVFRQEMQLLTSLNYSLPTSTVATWIEVFCTRTDVLTRGNATPLLRYAADVAKDLGRSLVHQTSMSPETPASAVAFGAWCLACALSCLMATLRNL